MEQGRWHNKSETSWLCDGTKSTDVYDYYDARPGDFALIDNNGCLSDGPDHTAIVIENDGEYIYTVEGNINNRVVRRRYHADTFKNTVNPKIVIAGFGEIDYENTGVVTIEEEMFKPLNPLFYLDDMEDSIEAYDEGDTETLTDIEPVMDEPVISWLPIKYE